MGAMRVLWCCCCLLVAGLGGAAAPEDREPVLPSPPPSRCSAPAAMVGGSRSLPRTAAAFHAGQGLSVLALGSSTTAGFGASSAAAAYPAQLERELGHRLPGLAVRVRNAGVSGETAAETLRRLPALLGGQAYDLVIWQAGANDAIQGVGMASFRKDLSRGADAVEGSGADLLLMTNQYVAEKRNNDMLAPYSEAVRDMAGEAGLDVFSRDLVMRHWVDSGQFTFETMLYKDYFHMSDDGYHCLAVALAEMIMDECGRAEEASRSRGGAGQGPR